ncbi:hypothetical protein ACWEJ6_47750, partial [Nonomuraea sp. NPDC004702]
MSAMGSQYVFVIQTRKDQDRSWSCVSDYGDADSQVAGRGVEDDAPGTPHDFGRAVFEAYLDHLVATAPEVVEYFLFEDDNATEWRILVWDVPATSHEQMSTVPAAGDRVRRLYPLAMVADGVVPRATRTWPGLVVRECLRAKAANSRGSDRMKAVGILQVGVPVLTAVATPFDLPAEANHAREVVDA